jgi:flagellar secretion chaperone FliS
MISDAALAYRQVSGQNPVRLVILLYEQLIDDLRRCVVALQSNEIEKRTVEMGHALLVLGHLQSALDLEKGGDVALNLERFYTLLRSSLLEAQAHASAAPLQEQISHLISLREAWLEVERTSAAASQDQRAPSTVDEDTMKPGGEWNV